MKEIKPKLLFKYDEYVNSTTSLLLELYSKVSQSIVLDDLVYKQAFESKLFVLLISSTTLFLEHEAKISKNIAEDLEQDITDEFLKRLSDEASVQLSWKHYYSQFSKVIKEILIKTSKDIESGAQFYGLSLILLEGIDVDEDTKNIMVANVSESLQYSMSKTLKLAKNTGLSPKFIGKPNFMILRD
ncbi:MAG: hypothetical protein GX038_04955 [Erysipelothrix sp.]|nr:hypothetical protein [Erysipelothrix sp.]